MNTGPEFLQLLALSVVVIVVLMLITAWRTRRMTPAARRQRARRSMKRAAGLLHAQRDRQLARYGDRHAP